MGRTTLNIGVISGGRAPNVIPDAARAEISFRTVDSGDTLRQAVTRAVAGRAAAKEAFSGPPMRFTSFDGLESTVVSYTTDVPAFANTWGQPFLIGPGSIHVAHTSEERIAKKELLEAAEIYKKMVAQLLTRASEAPRP
jgi:acetylornithine deacetylase